MGLLGILLALAVLMWLSFRGWSVLLLAPFAALLVAAFSAEPLLAHWTHTFMGSAAGFVGQFFPLFLLGALFGKLPFWKVKRYPVALPIPLNRSMRTRI